MFDRLEITTALSMMDYLEFRISWCHTKSSKFTWLLEISFLKTRPSFLRIKIQ